MDSNPPRSSNLVLCYTCIALGAFCILLTIAAALSLKNGIIERVRETPSVEGLGDVGKLNGIEWQIKSRDREIEFVKKKTDPQKSLQEARKKLGLKPDTNYADSNFEQERADEIRKLEEEKKQLIAKRDELLGQSRARQARPRSWGEWADDYGIELLLGVIPLGLFSLFLTSYVFGGKLPARNPLSLTGFERKCILFLPFAIVFSAFGFFLFVWILALIY